jgi:hypothetical protein
LASLLGLIWGLVTVALSAFMASSGAASGTALWGIATVSLSLAVRRGSRAAAWALVAVAALCLYALVAVGAVAPASVAAALVLAGLLVTSLMAARERPHPPEPVHDTASAEREQWRRFAYEFAVAQGVFTLLLITWSAQGGAPELGPTDVAVINLVDVGLVFLLALAIYKRKPFAIPLTLVYQCINAVVVTVKGRLGEETVTAIVIVGLYGAAAYYTRTSGTETPRSGAPPVDQLRISPES